MNFGVIQEKYFIKRQVLGVDPSVGGDKSAVVLVRDIDHIILRHFQDPKHERHYEVAGTKTLTGSLVHQAAELEAMLTRFEKCSVCIDATGLGIGIAHILESDHVYPRKITITGGNAPSHQGRKLNVPRTILIETLQKVIQQGKLKVLRSQHSDLLLKELESFRSEYTQDGKLRFEAEISRSLSHADFSFALACGIYSLENTGEVVAVQFPPGMRI